MKMKGAIFDLDGTLLDSMFVWDTIGENYLLSRGIEPRENLNEKFKTMSLMQAARYFQTEYGLADSIEEIMDGVNGMIMHFYTDAALPKPGVSDFLELLQSQGVRMCIATATDRHLAEAALKRNHLLGFFSDIFTCTGVGFGKDNPAVYDAALRHLGTSKADTLVFEDALYAIETAKKAGYTVAAVYDNSERNNQQRIKVKADFYSESVGGTRDYFDV